MLSLDVCDVLAVCTVPFLHCSLLRWCSLLARTCLDTFSRRFVGSAQKRNHFPRISLVILWNGLLNYSMILLNETAEDLIRIWFYFRSFIQIFYWPNILLAPWNLSWPYQEFYPEFKAISLDDPGDGKNKKIPCWQNCQNFDITKGPRLFVQTILVNIESD